MLITRKKKVPILWVFYAQLAFAISLWAGFMTGTPFLLAMKKFIDNPAAITFLLSLDILVTVLGGPFVNWLSDRIWTRYGRRKVLIAVADIGKVCIMPILPFAPDMWTLLALKWAYGIVSDMGTPNQALTMEVIPAAQRGRGAGFFQMQMNLANLIFWGVVLGRFDDVYFLGPLDGVLSLSGEHLMFFSASLLFLAVGAYTFMGFKEIKPPHRKAIGDERRHGEMFIWTFVRSFFKDVLGRDLLPLYLLLFAGSMASIGLGVLGPLLYIDQWGYTTQDMGTNVAIGAFINIFIALLAGYFADTTSKMRVYVSALLVGLFLKFAWVGYVFFKPGHRPELWEIVVFGEITAIFGMIAGTVSLPLILEYVERNRLGTAGAGMGLFRQLLNSLLSVFIGAWVVWWSICFLPQAGDYIELVFKKEKDKPALVSQLTSAGMDLKDVHLEPEHRPGTGAPSSRRWAIRRHTTESDRLQGEMKRIANEVTKWNSSLLSPVLPREKREAIIAKLSEARRRVKEIETQLSDSARKFSEQIANLTANDLATDGDQILAATDDGTSVTLDLEIVEPVTPELAAMLAEVLTSSELALEPDAKRPEEFRSRINVVPLSPPANGLHIVATRDARFYSILRALVESGASHDAASAQASLLIEILREALGRANDAFTLSDVVLYPDPSTPRLTFGIQAGASAQLLPAQELAGILEQASEISSATASDGDGALHLEVVLAHPLPSALQPDSSPVAERISSICGGDSFAKANLKAFYTRVVETAATKPVYLTVARPVVKQTYADRVYDYFFSVYFLMILGDLFGLGVIVLIIQLEKNGIVHRLGVEEDENR